MGVGTQVVIVVVEGEENVAVVHVSVRTQAGALPHPPAGHAAASIWQMLLVICGSMWMLRYARLRARRAMIRTRTLYECIFLS